MNLTGQQKRVHDYIKEFGSITSFEAFRDLGVSRLSAVIYELKRRQSKPVFSKTIKVKNRFGEETCVKQYAYRLKDLK